MFSRTIRVVTSVIAALTTFFTSFHLFSGVAHAGVAQPDEHTCADVAVVAARGSGQNTHITPTQYSATDSRMSNGWEAEHIREFLHMSEARYQETHNGASLMHGVDVIGIDDTYYQAGPQESETPNLESEESIMEELARIVGPGPSVIDDLPSLAKSLISSAVQGHDGVMKHIDDYESATGCTPSYVLVGYSQGAAILQGHERELAQRGQLAGVLYFGNPMTSFLDPAVIGVENGAGGFLGNTPWNSLTTAATDQRINFCLPIDIVCDTSIQILVASASTPGVHENYFTEESQWDDHIADSFGQWVDAVR
ncbi:cutinase family protein [Corynebacterium lubricantis]|uniref:cutinase family protein n=1 Tax=Corynebacterium lubricantis TaxID=541095 RepID=UPI00037C693C|nr:cutinase family protein [Corynebacterium lubricantis]